MEVLIFTEVTAFMEILKLRTFSSYLLKAVEIYEEIGVLSDKDHWSRIIQ